MLSSDFNLNNTLNVSTQFSENLSRRRTTRLTQSSTHDGRKASEGNDGVTDTNYVNCAHTAFYNKKAWFQVDLSKSFSIQKVKIYFRKGKGITDDILEGDKTKKFN